MLLAVFLDKYFRVKFNDMHKRLENQSIFINSRYLNDKQIDHRKNVSHFILSISVGSTKIQ